MRTLIFCALVVVLLVGGIVQAQEAAGTEAEPESGVFSGTFADSLWTIVTFVVLLAVLTRLAWRPLLDGLNARQTHIEQQLKSADDARVKAEHMFDDYRQQGLTVVREATEQAQRYQQQMTEKTRAEISALRRRAHEEIESARLMAVDDLWRQTGEIVSNVGREVLGRTLTDRDNQRLIDEAVARIRQNGGLE
jgi:F-type H+-transporting ATPase subunit b